MNMKEILLALLLLPVVFSDGTASPARNSAGDETRAPDPQVPSTPAEIFSIVESGILHGEHPAISKHFGRQLYVSLKGEESGYFSANQASQIIRSFFGSRKPASFSFTTTETEGDPFATGAGTFLGRGSKETLQIYVALTRQGNRWVISQFNVY